MAMDFSQVKNLTIPEGSVVKITDSNGVVLYNQTAYRELEYIHFNGAEYINLGFNVTSDDIANKIIEFKIDLSYDAVNNWSLMGYDTSSGNTRFNVGVNGSSYSRYGVSSFGGYQAGDGFVMTANTRYQVAVGYNSNNSNKAYYWDSINGRKTHSCNNLIATGNLYAGAVNFDGSPGNYSSSKVYQITYSVGTVNTIIKNFVPVQRKSDNVCGLYDKIANKFYPMQGTDITTTAAGPIVNENPIWANTILMNSYTNAGGSGTIFAVTTGSTPAETNTLLTFSQDPSYLLLTCTLYHGNVSGTGTKSGAIWVKSFNDSTGTYIINNSSNSSNTKTVTSVKIELKGSGTMVFAGCSGTAGGYTSSVELQYDKTNHILQVYRHGATQASTACRMSNITIEAYN